MELDPETVKEIRAILARNCVVEVTVAFYDTTEKLEPVDIGTTLEFDPHTPPDEQQADFGDLLDSLRDVFRDVSSRQHD